MESSLPSRRSIRLSSHDYSQAGWYYVTICTHDRSLILGKIVNSRMYLSPFGRSVTEVINLFPQYYPNLKIDEFQIMPNHIHIIIGIIDGDLQPDNINGRTQWSAPTKTSLSQIIQRFKTITTRQYIDGINNYGWKRFDGKLWQRNYYEHIVRDQHDMDRIRAYIDDNVVNWRKDRFHSPCIR